MTKDKAKAAARDAAEAKVKRREAYAAKRAAAEAMADFASPPATRQAAAVDTPHTVSSEEQELRRQVIMLRPPSYTSRVLTYCMRSV